MNANPNSRPRGHRAAKASQFPRNYDIRETSAMDKSNNAGTFNAVSVAGASESSNSLPGTNSQSPLSDDSMLTPSAGDNNYEANAEIDEHCAPRLRRIAEKHESMSWHLTERGGDSGTMDHAEFLTEIRGFGAKDSLMGDWRADPYMIEPDSAIHYTETYFAYVNNRLYYMFPRGRFLLWLNSCRSKSLVDNMLLYSIMALGSIFSDRPDRMAVMKRYSCIARYAVEYSQHDLSLQLAQTLIIMSLWYYAIGALGRSREAADAAVRAVCGLRYNVELGGVIKEQSAHCEYGLHPQALIECRRRTFWIAFLTDVSELLLFFPLHFCFEVLLISNCLASDVLLYTIDYFYLISNRFFATPLPRESLRGTGIYDGSILSSPSQSGVSSRQ